MVRESTNLMGETALATEADLLERRLSKIESELAQLKTAMRGNGPWWRQILGEFEGDDEYAEIARLGEEIRRNERPE